MTCVVFGTENSTNSFIYGGIIESVDSIRGHVQTIFVKNNVKMTFRGWGVKTRDVSRLLTGHLLRARGRQVTL